MARRGVAWPGKAGRDRLGRAKHGRAWRGKARQAWLGKARIGAARQCRRGTAELGTARPGAAMQAWRCGAGPCVARPVKAGKAVLGLACPGEARQGNAGSARKVNARSGWARLGKAVADEPVSDEKKVGLGEADLFIVGAGLIAIDWTFIEQLEGFMTIGYVPLDDAGKPLGKSGVTVGAGVDLGQWSEAQLRQRRVPDAIIEQVRPYLGVRGNEAVEILRHKPLNMSREDASTLTECIRSDILDDLVRRYDAASDRPFRYLDQQAQTVIASIAFQFGTDLAKATPRFWRQVTTRDWKAAHANLLNFVYLLCYAHS